MKYLSNIVVVFIVLMFPAIAFSESTEESESVCEEGSFISMAQLHERLISRSWPDIPPVARLMRMRVNAVFQIKVSESGAVCSVEPIGGSPIMIPPLTDEIKNWKFRPGRPFMGVLAIRYESGGGGFRLL